VPGVEREMPGVSFVVGCWWGYTRGVDHSFMKAWRQELSFAIHV
jgi:hypothetical protein